MGDKATAKSTMKANDVPTIPGSDGLVNSVKEGIKLANEIKYPIILKATAGGGGRGMRVVWSDDEFEAAWDSAKQESGAAFGNDGLYLEKFVENIATELSIKDDLYGNVLVSVTEAVNNAIILLDIINTLFTLCCFENRYNPAHTLCMS